jgi:hypothetical protein
MQNDEIRMTKSRQHSTWKPALPGKGHVMPPRFRAKIRSSAIRHSLAIALLALAFSSPLPAQSPAPVIAVPVKAATDGNVWGALIYASDKKPEEDSKEPVEFPDLFPRLAKVFPFKHFVILGHHNQVIFREYESWLVPSKDLFVKLDSKGAAKGGGINLHLQFWQGQQVLVKTDTVLRPASPLFIAGPKWRDGRLIFVLELKKVDAKLRP